MNAVPHDVIFPELEQDLHLPFAADQRNGIIKRHNIDRDKVPLFVTHFLDSIFHNSAFFLSWSHNHIIPACGKQGRIENDEEKNRRA